MIAFFVFVVLCHIEPSEEQRFQAYKKRFEKMSPAERKVAIDNLLHEAYSRCSQRYVTPTPGSWGYDVLKERLALRLKEYFKDK
jgi:hypothetical protein